MCNAVIRSRVFQIKCMSTLWSTFVCNLECLKRYFLYESQLNIKERVEWMFEWIVYSVDALFVCCCKMKRLRQNLYERDNCHPMKEFVLPWIQIPLWISMSLALRNMSGAINVSGVRRYFAHTQFNICSDWQVVLTFVTKLTTNSTDFVLQFGRYGDCPIRDVEQICQKPVFARVIRQTNFNSHH